MTHNRHATSRLLNLSGALMTFSGLLMALCEMASCALLFAAALCLFLAAHSFRLAEDREEAPAIAAQGPVKQPVSCAAREEADVSNP